MKIQGARVICIIIIIIHYVILLYSSSDGIKKKKQKKIYLKKGFAGTRIGHGMYKYCNISGATGGWEGGS